MYYLISIVLRKPEIILEADPLHDILELWQAHGVPNAMILEHVSIQSMLHYYTSAINNSYHNVNRERELTTLFGMPQAIPYDAETAETHRILMTIMQGTEAQIETLLDETEALIRVRTADSANLVFVFPLAHVRGFPGFQQKTRHTAN